MFGRSRSPLSCASDNSSKQTSSQRSEFGLAREIIIYCKCSPLSSSGLSSSESKPRRCQVQGKHYKNGYSRDFRIIVLIL